MRKYLFPLTFLIFLAIIASSSIAKAATATHVVISELQVAGDVTTDEFIELYNPTDSSVNLSNWRLARKTQSGTDANDLVTSLSGTIPSHGYFLIASVNYNGSPSADTTYPIDDGSLSSNNTLLLYDNNTALVDKVGLGSATDSETAGIANPTANKSVERKANSTSTVDSMSSGADVLMGNGEDTDNNSVDFITRAASEPQNSQSTTEPSAGPTPTASPTIEPTPTSTSSPTPTPSLAPTPTASPSVTPSPTPTATPVVTPTATPSPTPTLSPSPSPTASPDVTPTATPTASATPSSTPISTPEATPTVSPSVSPTATASPIATVKPTHTPTPGHENNFTCKVTYIPLNFGFFKMRIPLIMCGFGSFSFGR